MLLLIFLFFVLYRFSNLIPLSEHVFWIATVEISSPYPFIQSRRKDLVRKIFFLSLFVLLTTKTFLAHFKLKFSFLNPLKRSEEQRFSCFQVVLKETSSMKWVNSLMLGGKRVKGLRYFDVPKETVKIFSR